MSSLDAVILEGGLARYTPCVVALTTDTKENVDFGGVLHQIMKTAPWSGSTVIDRQEVCHWFVNNVTDPAYAGTVAEIKAQLPLAGHDTVVPVDANLVSICIKHRIMAVAYEREVKRLAALDREAKERQDMIEQFMEDGMTEAAATAEAERELAVEEDDEDPVEPPPDIVILKHFPQTAADFSSLDKVGVVVSVTLVLNSQARFGRKEEASIDPKDKTQRRRLDAKKPDVRRGKAGREDQDRLEPLTTQVTRELNKIGLLDRSILRESAFLTFDVQCVDAGVSEDGSKLYRAKESEGAVADTLNKELTSMLESAMRYRTWIGNKSFLKVPKLNIRRVVADQTKPVVPAPTSSKATKKGRGKVEVEAPREEAPPLPLLPDLPPACSHLPISNAAFRRAVQSLAGEGVVLDSTSLLNAVVEQVGSFKVGEDALMVDADRIKDDDDVVSQTAEELQKIAASLAASLLSSIDGQSSSSVTTTTISNPATFNTWKASLEAGIVTMLLGSQASEGPTSGGAVGIACSPAEANRLVVQAAQRGELGGASFKADLDDETFSRLDITTTAPDRKTRFHLLSTDFVGRVPFPVFLAWERQSEAEWEHYNPLPNDDEELFEEEEEEEEELDEDGVPIPRAPKTYPIEYRNFSEERAQLIRRRAVYDLLAQRLQTSSSEVLEACSHLLASVTNETFAMYPSDGSTICAHRTATNTDSSSCVVYSEGGDTAFGFHAHRGLLYRMPELPIRGDTTTKPISSGIRCFFSDVRSQLRMVVESSIRDPSPPRVVHPRRTDTVPDPANASGKRNNTPRSQKATAPTPAHVVVVEEPSTPVNGVTPVPTHGVDVQPPKLHVTLSIPNELECVANPENLTLGSLVKDEALSVAVYCNGDVLVAEDVVVEWGVFRDGIVKLIGEYTSLTIFPNGDIATQCGGVWLYTAVSGARRAYSPAHGAIDLQPVPQATQTTTQCTRTTRDDHVVTEIISSLSTTTFASLVTVVTSGNTIAYSCGKVKPFTVSADDKGVSIEAGQVGVALRGPHLIVECTAARSCVLDWTTGVMFVDPNPAEPVHYAVDCLRGGLRSRDESHAYIVSPFGRVWQGTIAAEEASTPRDLATKHVVDRFADLPETVSPMFEAALQLVSLYPIEASLYHNRGFPEIPKGALKSRLLAPTRDFSLLSAYKAEYVRDVDMRINTALSKAESTASRGGSLFSYQDNGECLVTPVAGEYAYLRQRLLHKDPTALYCHTAPGSTVFLLQGEEPVVLIEGQSSDADTSVPQLVQDARVAASTNVNPIIGVDSDEANSIVPITGGGPISHIQSSTWMSPVDELHANLSLTQKMKQNYWCSSGAEAAVMPYSLPIKKAPVTSAAVSPKKTSSPAAAIPPQPPQKPKAYANPTPPSIPIASTAAKRFARVMQATPAELKVGDMSVGYQYKTAFALTNLTTRSCRFRITSNVPSVSVVYDQVPMAAGMTTTVAVIINCKDQGDTHVKIKVAYEGGAIEIPCLFNGLECTNSKVVVPGAAQVMGLLAA